jgi:hypothetical protein
MSTTPKIRGVDLEIDDSIQKICEASNATSSSTRSVLYILLIINILSIIIILNTRENNWSYSRLKNIHKSIIANHGDPTRLDSLKAVEAALIRNRVDNVQTVKLPILGNAFDVNDLIIIVGFSFVILLVILRFTMMREVNNLKIALHGISERYPGDANKETFQPYLDAQARINTTLKEEDLLEAINFTRRKYHYNFLSMNEIFTLPPLEVEEEDIHERKGPMEKREDESTVEKKSKKGRRGWLSSFLLAYMYWIPAIIYFFILRNDIRSMEFGWGSSEDNTRLGFAIGTVCLVCIAVLCHRAVTQKKTIDFLNSDFEASNYWYSGKKGINSSYRPAIFAILLQLVLLVWTALKYGVLAKLIGL